MPGNKWNLGAHSPDREAIANRTLGAVLVLLRNPNNYQRGHCLMDWLALDCWAAFGSQFLIVPTNN